MWWGLLACSSHACACQRPLLHLSPLHQPKPCQQDNDSLRRGKPTNHVIYGEDVAILAGDALLSTAFEHVAKHTPKSVPPERIVEVISRLGASVGATGLAGGQVGSGLWVMGGTGLIWGSRVSIAILVACYAT